MSITDIERMRFAYSPLVEVAESLYMLSTGRINPLHAGWFEAVREELRRVDRELLGTVVPARNRLASFLMLGATDAATRIESQLDIVAAYPTDLLAADLDAVWHGEPPPLVADLVARDGGRRIADALWRYWEIAIAPYWPQIRAVLDDDVAYRAGRLTSGGIEALMTDLHPQLAVEGDALTVERRHHTSDHTLTGGGLVLVPSVFAWPHVIVETQRGPAPVITYGSRGVGTLWSTDARPATDEDALGALLGRSRAAILAGLALPRSTTELAAELDQTPPAVSQHLSVLRRSGMVMSWRSGRRVLYQRTALGTSLLTACSADHSERLA
jgi:DNA-binding transcriptional ArsR family regulator